MARIAFHTYGVMRADWGDAPVRGFEERIPAAFAAAEAMPGFILRLPNRTEDERLRTPHFFDPVAHIAVALTVSVWEDLPSVFAYAYGGPHREALRKRGEWFVPPQWPTYVAWWIGDDELPTHGEAVTRLEHLHDHGPTPFAFTFRRPFDPQGSPLPRVTARTPAPLPSHP